MLRVDADSKDAVRCCECPFENDRIGCDAEPGCPSRVPPEDTHPEEHF